MSFLPTSERLRIASVSRTSTYEMPIQANSDRRPMAGGSEPESSTSPGAGTDDAGRRHGSVRNLSHILKEPSVSVGRCVLICNVATERTVAEFSMAGRVFAGGRRLLPSACSRRKLERAVENSRQRWVRGGSCADQDGFGFTVGTDQQRHVQVAALAPVGCDHMP